MPESYTKNPLHEVAAQAAVLGAVFGCSVPHLVSSRFLGFPLYTASLAVFHFLEYWTTARYNTSKVSIDSFLINHSGAYSAAHAAALTEAAVEYFLFPAWKTRYRWVTILGFLVLVASQLLRSLAMKTAGESFSHIIVTRRENKHRLVTHGVYAISRHPSYTGYFWWALGSQLVLCNPVCFVAFAVVLYRFFRDRIRYEEEYLVAFFGQEYKEYRKGKGVYIPFIH